MPEGKVITWDVLTHDHRERSNDWYWALGTLAVVGAGFSIWFQNGLLAIVLLVGAGCLGFLVARGPREHSIHIDSRGITVDGTVYPYSSIRSFWVERDVEFPRLLVATNGIINPHFSIPLDSQEQGREVRAHLIDYVKEEEQHPHFGEHLAEIFGL